MHAAARTPHQTQDMNRSYHRQPPVWTLPCCVAQWGSGPSPL